MGLTQSRRNQIRKISMNYNQVILVVLLSQLLLGCQYDSNQDAAYGAALDKPSAGLSPCQNINDSNKSHFPRPTNCEVSQSPLFYSGIVQEYVLEDPTAGAYVLHGKRIDGGASAVTDFVLQGASLDFSKFSGQEVVLTGLPHKGETVQNMQVIDVKSIEVDGVVSTQ